MLLSLFQYIKGYLQIRVVGYSPERFLNACSYRGICLWGITPSEGAYDMFISLSDFRKLKPVIKKTGAKVVIRERIGIPFSLFRYKKRKMFFAGAVFGIALIYFLSLFVWSIEIQGNRKYTDEALISFLEEQGVAHGMRLSKVDCDRIVKDIRRSYDEIIWVSASVDGCRLIIQIKENEDSADVISVQNETQSPQEEGIGTEGIEAGTDIVADRDGVIEKIIVRKGLPCVKEGDQVRKGQILVTGAVPVVDDAGEITGYQFQEAEADIRAQVEIPYESTCGVEYEQKNYASVKKEAAYLRIGDYLFWLGSLKHSFEYAEEFTTANQFCIGKYFYLPVFWGSKVTTPYAPEKTRYENKEIQAILSEEYHRFAETLEKKGVEIIENDVKIYTEPLQAKAMGTLSVIMDMGTGQPTSIAEDVANGND